MVSQWGHTSPMDHRQAALEDRERERERATRATGLHLGDQTGRQALGLQHRVERQGVLQRARGDD